MKEEYRSDRYIGFLIILSGLIALLDTSMSAIELIAIPYMLKYFEITLGTFALYQGYAGILSLLVFLPAWIADKFGRKLGLMINILSMSVPALLIAIIPELTVQVFFILYAVLIFGANSNLWTLAIAEESRTKKRSLNTNLVYIMSLFPVILIFAVWIIEKHGWPWLYGISGIAGLGLFLISFRMRETLIWTQQQSYDIKQQLEYKSPAKSHLPPWNRRDGRTIFLLGFSYFVWGMMFKIMNTTVSIFFTDLLGFTIDDFQLVLFLIIAISIVGSIITAKFMDYKGRKLAFILSFGLSSLNVFLLAFTLSPVFIVSSFFFLSTCIGFLIVYTPEAFSTDKRGKSMGIVLVFARLGFILGPLLIFTIITDQLSLYQYRQLYFLGGFLLSFPLIMRLFIDLNETKSYSLAEIDRWDKLQKVQQ